MNGQRNIPEWQQAVIDKCYHPTGVWEEFLESEYETSIPARFEKIVERFPERLAVVDEQRSLTYAELNAAANRVAHGLLARLGPDPEPVVHLFEQNVDAVIALLGIMKAGKFYVPLDTRSPADYLRGTLSLLESRLLLADETARRQAENVADGLTVISTLAEVSGDADNNPGVTVGPDDYLYVIFTSGSTGVPKGVIENHRNALRYSALYINYCHVCLQDRNLLTLRLSFSGSVNSFYGSLLSGSTQYIYDIYRLGIANLPAWIAQHSLTIITFTPPVFRLLAEVAQDASAFASVRLLRSGADRILPTDLAAYRRLLPDTALFRSGLGASEAKGITEVMHDKESAGAIQEISVGWPVHDVDILIVDEEGNWLAPGKTGEIVVHSRFISPGYWKTPELTRQKFRPDPDAPGFVYYSTGDLGRIEADGSLSFLGRIDFQVKIQGQRVELGEIENALLSLDGVRETVVALRGDTVTEQRLLAWLVWNDPARRLTSSQLRHHLAKQLPAHMIPSRFISMTRFPLNANGKIDRQNLPVPDPSRAVLDVAFIPPTTPFEQTIAAIWRDILGLDAIGIHDPFLDLGGNSLQAMRIAARVQEEFGVEIPLAELFAASTVAEMALLIVTYLAATVDLPALFEGKENV